MRTAFLKHNKVTVHTFGSRRVGTGFQEETITPSFYFPCASTLVGEPHYS